MGKDLTRKKISKTKPKKKRVITKKECRKIIRRPSTPWIYFCKEKRNEIKEKYPDLKFNEIPKYISAIWKNLSETDKRPYHTLYQKDKERYEKAVKLLSKDQKSILKKYKVLKRKKVKNKPSSPLSAYMFYVKDIRQSLVENNPGANFEMIGKLLGQSWKELNTDNKDKYVKLSSQDKNRYYKQLGLFHQSKHKNLV